MLPADHGLADGTIIRVLDTPLDGALSASFLNKNVNNFCQADGAGMLLDQNVGIDHEIYKVVTDLAPLIGSDIELVVTATDRNGRTASGSVMVHD